MRVVRGDGDGAAVDASVTLEQQTRGCGVAEGICDSAGRLAPLQGQRGLRTLVRVWRPHSSAGSDPKVALQALARAAQPRS